MPRPDGFQELVKAVLGLDPPAGGCHACADVIGQTGVVFVAVHDTAHIPDTVKEFPLGIGDLGQGPRFLVADQEICLLVVLEVFVAETVEQQSRLCSPSTWYTYLDRLPSNSPAMSGWGCRRSPLIVEKSLWLEVTKA